MKFKKLMAGTLAAAMVVGNGMTAFASEANEATGQGTAFEHVDTEITSVTLPTTTDVASVFNYYVDPERAINSAGTLANGTAVEDNDDGVYFAHPSAETPAVNASVTAFSIGGKSETDTGVTVEVPETTAVTELTYSKGWKKTDGTVVTVSALDSSNAAVTPAKGDTVTVDSTGNVTAISIAALPGQTTSDGVNATVTVTGASDETVEYHDEWKAADGTEVVPTITGATAVDRDTITITAYQAGTPAGGTSTFSSSSEAVAFEGKNSVDVDVSVAASVEATAGGKDITLVADQAALDAATSPALLMTLKVGSDSKAITSDGTTAKAMIAGKPNNFKVTASGGKFVYGIRTNTDETALDTWGSTSVQLVGKTNQKNIPAGAGAMTAPKIKLTWTVAKHVASYVSTNTITSTANTVTMTLPTGVTVTKAELYKVGADTPTALVSNNTYTVSGTSLTIKNTVAANNSGARVVVTFSDNHTETLTIS